jgi:hypothetical protein
MLAAGAPKYGSDGLPSTGEAPRHGPMLAPHRIYRLQMDRCAGCGFVYDLERARQAWAAILSGSVDISTVLQRSDGAVLRARPQPAVWSPLEYGCHVRDVLLVQRERVLAARRIDRPSFDPMGRDERVEHDGYRDQHPADVARQLHDAAAMFVNVLQRLEPTDWERMLTYNYPKRFERSLRWVAVHTEHEVVHHLQDVRAQLADD